MFAPVVLTIEQQRKMRALLESTCQSLLPEKKLRDELELAKSTC